MNMQMHSLKRKTENKSKKTVGRGGTRGKTSGRGHKGQKARAGTGGRPEYRDMIKKLPKLRGHGINRARTVNANKIKPFGVNVSILEENFEKGATVNAQSLVDAGILKTRGGKLPKVKILGFGDLAKKLEIVGCAVSASAREKIESAGGTIKA